MTHTLASLTKSGHVDFELTRALKHNNMSLVYVLPRGGERNDCIKKLQTYDIAPPREGKVCYSQLRRAIVSDVPSVPYLLFSDENSKRSHCIIYKSTKNKRLKHMDRR